MKTVAFVPFYQVNPNALMVVLNEDSLRTHLIGHPYFDEHSIKEWITEKIAVDSLQGCRIRAVTVDDELAGWCGIQPDDEGYELAIVIGKNFWGHGITIFKHLLTWARELEHKEILFHLLETRREYRALNKLATRVYETRLLGRNFTTYVVPVSARL